ncbi:MAG: hypothetical protein K2N74_04335 [Clostridiales bacterium]|nr:hypothetical protein [Clostridiales bacterium]
MYICTWENCSVTQEDYYSAYSALAGATASQIELERNGLRGIIEPNSEYMTAYHTLAHGNLGEIYSLKPAVARLERAALWRSFRSRVWYDGGYFIYNGEKVDRSSAQKCDELVLLEGSVSASVLKRTEAKKLCVRARAEITAAALAGTAVESLEAESPYSANASALYLDTPGGTRLIVGVPSARSLTITGNEFADKGALFPCKNLEELTVPFAGNTVYSHASEYDGMFAWLFLDGGDYFVPSTLKRVKVTGGILADFAFYRCSEIEEIDVCGLNAADISPTAFVSCTGWKKIHCPQTDILLAGQYTSYIADCGCTVFERTER